MLRIIYISTARQVTTRSQRGEILRVSRENNARVGVTGLLIAGGRRFLQALEGCSEEVETTFARIRQDGRHLGVVVLARQVADERVFGNWAMGGHLASTAGERAGHGSDVDFLVQQIRDARIRAEFEQFVAQQAA